MKQKEKRNWEKENGKVGDQEWKVLFLRSSLRDCNLKILYPSRGGKTSPKTNSIFHQQHVGSIRETVSD